MTKQLSIKKNFRFTVCKILTQKPIIIFELPKVHQSFETKKGKTSTHKGSIIILSTHSLGN